MIYYTGSIILRSILASLLLFIGTGSCKVGSGEDQQAPSPKEQKDRIFTHQAPITFPEKDLHDDLWKKVDSLEKKGLYRSALSIVDTILTKAEKEKNTAEHVKALMHKYRYTSLIGELDAADVIQELRNRADSVHFPLDAILHSFSGQAIWGYYQSNRYRFFNRTSGGSGGKNIRTWSLERLIGEAVAEYEASLLPKDSLARVPVEELLPILESTGDTIEPDRNIRPTLFDILAHRALDLFEDAEGELTRPSYAFSVDTSAYLGSVKTFIALELRTKDTLSVQFKAMQVVKDLLRLHRNDKDPRALVHSNLRRLDIAHSYATFPNKDSLYKNALRTLMKKYSDEPVHALIAHELASFIHQNSNAGIPVPDEFKDSRKKALSIARKGYEQYPESFGGRACKNLMDRIRGKGLSVRVPVGVPPKEKYRASLEYRNIDKVYCKLVPIPWKEWLEIESMGYRIKEEKILRHASKRVGESWTQELPKTNDLYSHRVEIPIKASEKGHYILFISTSPGYTTKGNAVTFDHVTVTDLAYTVRRRPNYRYDIKVMDRKTGKALPGTKVEVHKKEYGHGHGYQYKEELSFHTDEKGEGSIAPGSSYRQFKLLIRNGEDILLSDRGFYQSRPYSYGRRDDPKVDFFTDRSIYRPGQPIHFKGILTDRNDGNPKILPDQEVTVMFRDVNHQVIKERTFTTNDYGTFHGTFHAPDGRLNGRMQIQTKHGHTYVSVEEYKRPEFEVEFDPVKGSYKLGEKVTVTGKASSFTGASVDGAEVTYSVTRRARFPYWWAYRPWYNPSAPTRQIVKGKVETNGDGTFDITFRAIPDKTISKDYDPVFTYQVNANVTDITGESHSANTFVSVSDHALNIHTDVPEKLNVAKEDTFHIWTRNLNGQEIPASGKIEVFKLEEPNRVLRNRIYEAPDKWVIDSSDFVTDHPHDVYKNEHLVQEWEKEKKVFSQGFDTEKEDFFLMPGLQHLEAGSYVFILTSQDKFGNKVEQKVHSTLYDHRDKDIPVQEPAWFHMVKGKGEPGEKARFLIGSAYEDVAISFEVEHDREVIHQETIRLSNEQRLIEYPIKEEFRGNFSVHFTFVKNERHYAFDRVVTVPYSNKELDLEFQTFRDKLRPGKKEKWRVKIRGPEGDKVAAEFLAGMYDASLDKIQGHSWYFSPFRYHYSELRWSSSTTFSASYARLLSEDWNEYTPMPSPVYYQFRNFGYHLGSTRFYRARFSADREMAAGEPMKMEESKATGATVAETEEAETSMDKNSVSSRSSGMDQVQQVGGATPNQKEGEKGSAGLQNIKARKDFRETAFFYPDLKTNESGDVIFEFTVPEALTEWKFMGLAHTKDLKTGTIREEVVTSKPMMIKGYPPRFMRKGDKIQLKAKIMSLEDSSIQGKAELMLFDALTMEPVNASFHNENKTRSFKVGAGKSTSLAWDLKVPEDVDALTYRVVAKAGKFSDGEEDALPILTDRKLVTETKALPVRGKGTHEFEFSSLKKSRSKEGIRHRSVTLEYTNEPIWYAVQAIPYMMEYPHECSEQVFTRYYGNVLAEDMVHSHPRIKRVLDRWSQAEPNAFLSKLEKNQELKEVLLKETPWVMEAKNEAERKRRVATLFDMDRMAREKSKALRKLQDLQYSNGAWPWFKGMAENRYITQHILSGLGHLKELGVLEGQDTQGLVMEMARKAINYLDQELASDFRFIQNHYPGSMDKDHLGYVQTHYLYVRSMFPEIQMGGNVEKAYSYFLQQAQDHWTNKNLYGEGMLALALHREGKKNIADGIVKSLDERAKRDKEMGMYWESFSSGYYWYQAGIEKHALMVEVFDVVAGDDEAVEDLKVWLLKQKQVQDWGTTKATAEACYALLLRGKDDLEKSPMPIIHLGGTKVDPASDETIQKEAGTGYFKKTWHEKEVRSEMGSIKVESRKEGVSWGALYWQYFQDLDKIEGHQGPLSVEKKMFKEVQGDRGKELEPLEEGSTLEPGDRVKVRMVVRTDRTMEYVHLRDMRASGLEPVKILSGYEYQDGLGYYRTSGDVATDMFFDRLPKGTYVLEYPLKVSHKGDFSNGIATIQCMYAPEFAAHSDGIRIKVGN